MQRLFSRIDWYLIIPVAILLFISLITLFSINIVFFRTQLIFTILAIVLFLICSQANYLSLKQYALPIYIASLVILAIVLVLGIESRGSVRWLEFLGLRIQFSEIFKPLLAISLASFLSQRKISMSNMLLTLGFLVPVAMLIFRQPDLGNAIIYGATVVLTLVFYGFPLPWLLVGGGVIAIITPLLFRFLRQYQQERLLTFFHLKSDPLGISYNAIQSVIAVGSGMILGKGLGQGTQSTLRFLPERHTDFIFATISEELGLIGGIIVIACFGYLFYRLYVVIQESSDNYVRIFVSICFWVFFIQFFLNIGMNIGITPIVGVTLPFVSYGGSSLLSCAIFLGFVSGMRGRREKRFLEIA